MHIRKKVYGDNRQGQTVYEYTMKNPCGMEVSVLNLGGIITRILVPDRNGNFKNVVLELNSLDGYEENPAYIGAIIGRYAGRIKDSVINIDGQEYMLDRNEGENCLHGGFLGFNKVLWNVAERTADDAAELCLTYLSRDGEGGFPGNLKISVTYKLHKDNSLEIAYEAVSDKKTAVSLTNHSYFNLSGEIETVEDHRLRINTPFLLDVGKDMLAGEKIIDLRQYGMDGENVRAIREYMRALDKVSGFMGIDHTFIINRESMRGLSLAAEYQHQGSGRILSVYTDLPYINIYSGNFLNESIVLKGELGAVRHGGICFETQEQPNGPQHLQLGYEFLKPNEIYKKSTIFKFTAE